MDDRIHISSIVLHRGEEPPISGEKGVVNVFFPSCNMQCFYCQNWEISTSREMNLLAEEASPSQIASNAANWQCSSVAFTYNDPVIFAEYAIDTALACRAAGLASIAVTAGYINPEARRDFFAVMDAANIDLKGFSDSFYQQVTGARLRPVLDTISYAVHETNVWVELTTLLLPGYNDASSDLREMCRWIVTELGPDVPLHFTAFHPDNRMRDLPRTPSRTLARARAIAQEEGLHYVYTGNIEDPDGQTTYCPNCKSPVIRRDRYTIDSYDLDAEGRCRVCGTQIPGRFGGSSVVDHSFRLPHRVAIR